MGKPNPGTTAILVGLAVILLGIGLAFWGPQIEITDDSTSSDGSGNVVVRIISSVREPACPVGIISAAGGLVLAFGVVYRVKNR